MSLSSWIMSISAATVGILLSIAAYFAKKWMDSVDETLKEHSRDFKSISKQISTLEQKQSTQAESLSKAIQATSFGPGIASGKFDNLAQEVSLIRRTIQDKLLPQQESLQEYYGRIIVLEDSVREQNEKLNTMYSAVKILVQKQKDQK